MLDCYLHLWEAVEGGLSSEGSVEDVPFGLIELRKIWMGRDGMAFEPLIVQWRVFTAFELLEFCCSGGRTCEGLKLELLYPTSMLPVDIIPMYVQISKSQKKFNHQDIFLLAPAYHNITL